MAGEAAEPMAFASPPAGMHGYPINSTGQYLLTDPAFTLADSAAVRVGIEPADWHGLIAQAIAFPAAELLPTLLDHAASGESGLVAKIVADALASAPAEIDELLAALPDTRLATWSSHETIEMHSTTQWAGVEGAAFTAWHLPVEALALHPDTVAMA
jgi:hypothetical protein